MHDQGWVHAEAERIRAAGRWRERRTFDAVGPVGRVQGREVVSFASNDYLGLSTHPQVCDAARGAIDRWGAGSTASRLVVGSRPCHDGLEEALRDWKRTDDALVFSSGYAANLGVLGALGGPDCLIVSDELNHASIVDGCRLSRSPVAIARHNDVEHVDSLLRSATTARSIVVADTVFSMDGDEAPVAELGAVCARRGALLVLDEAHAVLGPPVDALTEMEGLDLLRVATMSKVLGSMGGAVCGSSALVELLVNRARPFIFSTALSPADTAGAAAAIAVLLSDEGSELIERLAAVVERVAPGHRSPIVSVQLGSEDAAVAASAALLERGLFIPAIRPPTVAPGTSRLRVALSAAHTEAMIDRLLDATRDIGVTLDG